MRAAPEEARPDGLGALPCGRSPSLLRGVNLPACLQMIAEKVQYALGQGLGVVYCIGEKLEEREAGNTMAVNARQMKVRGRRAWTVPGGRASPGGGGPGAAPRPSVPAR